MARIHLDRLRTLCATALVSGAQRRTLGEIEWTISDRCESPVTVQLHSRPEGVPGHVLDWTDAGGPRSRRVQNRDVNVDPGGQLPLALTIHARCRKCGNCLRQRRSLWAYRAKVETEASVRTWFGTLTLSPEARYLMQCRAFVRLRRRAVAIEEMDAKSLFLAKHREISPEITKMLKRVRKNTGAQIRYLVVAEAHKDGEPHYHMLVHEQSETDKVGRRDLEREWKLGFSSWRVVADIASATYVCKYLAKNSQARVRASLNYGTLPMDRYALMRPGGTPGPARS